MNKQNPVNSPSQRHLLIIPLTLIVFCLLQQDKIHAQNTILLPDTATWNFFHPTDGVDPAIADPDFNTTWYTQNDPGNSYDGPAFSNSGSGLFGYGDIRFRPITAPIGVGDPPTTGAPGIGNRYTAYFTTTFDLGTKPANQEALIVDILADDGAFIYVNGVLSNSIGMPAGAQDTYQQLAFFSGLLSEDIIYKLLLNQSLLVDGLNTISVSIHNQTSRSSDLGFYFSVREFPQKARAETHRGVIRSGSQAPGLEPDVTFFTPAFGQNINNNESVAVLGHVTGPNVNDTNDFGYWLEESGTLALIAREGDRAPGTPSGTNFQKLPGVLYINSQNNIVFRADLTGEGVNESNNRGIWSNRSGVVELIARKGMSAPGTLDAALYSDLEFPVFNSSNQIAFKADLTGIAVDETNNEGIWLYSSNKSELVARKGEQAPETLIGTYFSDIFTPSLSSSGQLIFLGHLKGDSVDDSNNEGIWVGTPGALTLIAREGTSAPGTSDGINIGQLGFSRLNSSGEILMRQKLTGEGVDDSNNEGIWFGKPNALELVVRKGDQAPGTLPGVSLDSFNGSRTSLNNKGEFVFSGLLTGAGVNDTNDFGLWVKRDDSLQLLVRSGDNLPGTPSGVKFASFPSGPIINNNGQVAFWGRLTGKGIVSNSNFNSEGIWAEDLNGELQLIIRTGDYFEVEPGNFQIVRSISFTARSEIDGRSGGFNDKGQVTFSAFFTDGTAGIFVSNLVAVPEPSAFLLILLGSVGLLAMGRKRRR